MREYESKDAGAEPIVKMADGTTIIFVYSTLTNCHTQSITYDIMLLRTNCRDG